MVGRLRPGDRPLHWIGSSKKDFLAFPVDVQGDIGYALGLAQLGGIHPKAKPWKGQGPGVFEIADEYDGDTYRAVYTVKFEKAVYMLHAFQKKSPTGIETAQHDVDLIKRRLKAAQQDYEVQYGQKE